MKQTAVEWLIEHLNLDETSPNYNKLIIEQAKEIEKEQIIAAYWASYKEGQYSGDKTADEYYNENFKQEIEKL
jgi:hypothetical protein